MANSVFRAVLVGGIIISAVATATPAHAAVLATGNFAYSDRVDLCVETYAGTQAGFGACSVTLNVGTFAIRVLHDQDGTCSGVAQATANITSPTLVHPPQASGYLVVSHGIGTFTGNGFTGVAYSFVEATLTGSVCRPQTEIGEHQTFSGKYEWQR